MILTWGSNEWGQLGHGNVGRAVLRASGAPAFGPVQNPERIIAGAGHTMIRCAGVCYGVGANIYGGLCVGHKDTPVLRAERALLVDVDEFALMESHGLAITQHGAVTWGGNMYGQIGNGTWTEGHERLEPPGCYATPQVPTLIPDLEVVGGGQYHNLAIDRTGRMWAWGFGDKGQLGTGVAKTTLIPTKLAATTVRPLQVDGGAKHSGALYADGTVRLWGSNRFGQLATGLGTVSVNRPLPVLQTVVRFIQVSCGGNFTLLLTDTGNVFKAGVFHAEEEPVEGVNPVPFPEAIQHVSAGTNHAIAIGESGNVYGWGHNRYGQVGDGTQSLPGGVNHDKPVPVPLGFTARAVSAGWVHSAALQ